VVDQQNAFANSNQHNLNHLKCYSMQHFLICFTLSTFTIKPRLYLQLGKHLIKLSLSASQAFFTTKQKSICTGCVKKLLSFHSKYSSN